MNIDVAELPAVKVGDRGTITLPDGQTVPGLVTRIGTVATGDSGTSTVPIHIALAHPAAAGSIDRAQVNVRITTATVKRALAVPVTALVGIGHGRFALDTIEAHHARRVVPVTAGLLDDTQGLVQVSSPTLTAGQQIALPATSTAYAAHTTASPERGLSSKLSIKVRRLID